MDKRHSAPHLLENITIFSGICIEELKEINSKITWHVYPKSEIILNFHEQSNDVYFIQQGAVRATTYSLSGKEIAYQDLLEGDMFGELSAIDNKGRITGIITTQACSIGKMSADHFIDTMNTYPSVNQKVLLRLTDLIRFLCGRIYEFSALDVKDRIRAEIIRQARLNNDGENTAIIEKMPTHEEIANKISTHREAVTKEFGYLVKEKLIEKQGRTIIVPDLDKLAGRLFEEIS